MNWSLQKKSELQKFQKFIPNNKFLWSALLLQNIPSENEFESWTVYIFAIYLDLNILDIYF